MNKIEVPLHAINAFLEVRDTGKTNMFDANTVLYIMFELGHYDSVCWLIEQNHNSERIGYNAEKYIALMNAVSDHLNVTMTLNMEG